MTISENSFISIGLVGVIVVLSFWVGVSYGDIGNIKEDVTDMKVAISKLTEIVSELKGRHGH